MNILAAVFLIILSVSIFFSSRTKAVIPLLIGSCYMTLGQGLELGFVSLPIFRILLFVGLIRSVLKNEFSRFSYNNLDILLALLSLWLLFSSFFHNGLDGSGPVYISGSIFNIVLIYLLVRIWSVNMIEVYDLVKVIAILLFPVAICMTLEILTAKNIFSYFGGVPEDVLRRAGRLRAQGPFKHPILAGTVGATCIPLFIGLFRRCQSLSILGIFSAMLMVITSSSSGPVMTLIAGLSALILWIKKGLTKVIFYSSIVCYLILSLMMEKPPYYLISRIDISGGSTGWHRSYLIEQTFNHLSEWWLFGTDHTRHWMPNQGIGSSIYHTDITNYYIGFGVMGGLLSMILLISIIGISIKWSYFLQISSSTLMHDHKFMVWSLGSSIFAHAVTALSVSYFDQSMIFIWMNIAIISSIYSAHSKKVLNDNFSNSKKIIDSTAGGAVSNHTS
jgi:hypothetical protein